MSRVLVTGGAGFIGSHLCEALVERGDEVYVIDDLSTGRLENVAQLDGHRAFHFTSGTILNYPLLESLVRKVDRIFHLAAVVGVQKIIEVPIDTIEINVLGAHNVLTLAARHNKPCLLASSSEVYGKSNKHLFHAQHAAYPDKTLKEWYQYLEFSDGTTRRMTKEENETQTIPKGARRFNVDNMTSPNTTAALK